MNVIKKKRGNKICPICGHGNGARSFNCKSCDFAFKTKTKKIRKTTNFDWTTLTRGDIIKVIGGSGPYWQDKEGDRHYLTDRGKYSVLQIVENGIHVRSMKSGGKQFLYMNSVVKSDLCFNLYRAPHKIILVRSING